MKINKVNIGTMESAKFDSIRDYWDDSKMGKITDILHEFQDLFPKQYSNMKGISWDSPTYKCIR